ncbi:mitochondrial cardiolipin hydrolase-like [Contarinia nasturtii]|uniref:mitochondrial cardiolipin hydrolase-like n=1 Tax=Contarinia nasturtii TaxID=265458 RepID=UPI0012D49995|nr:mitochondrial cardiolipin hydrolase-like [Contarinia nasturtii]
MSDDPDCCSSNNLKKHLVCRSKHCWGKLLKKLIDKIDSAEKSISIAMYNMYNDQLINNIVKARLRGVNVKLIMDKSNILDIEDGRKLNAARNLQTAGVNVKVAGDERKLMHNKFCLIDPMSPNSVLINGSLNWSTGGIKNNYENVMFLTDQHLIKQYKQAFEYMWEKDTSPFIG